MQANDPHAGPHRHGWEFLQRTSAMGMILLLPNCYPNLHLSPLGTKRLRGCTQAKTIKMSHMESKWAT